MKTASPTKRKDAASAAPVSTSSSEWARMDSNHRRQSHQIYSPICDATQADSTSSVASAIELKPSARPSADRRAIVKPAAYYNENDSFAAGWLRNLISAGHIAPGDVDERSITDVKPEDVKGYTQCHFFAGIGGWPLALRLAGWPDDRNVWTGSCPCQSFSIAGKGEGKEDARHLWPEMFRIVRESGPSILFGEQVEEAISHEWLDGVFVDLEGQGYACGATIIPAAGVNAPHRRHRIFWVADARFTECGRRGEPGREHGRTLHIADRCRARAMAVALGDGIGPRLEGHAGHGDYRDQSGRFDAQPAGSTSPAGPIGFWSDFNLLNCRDGKSRRASTECGAFPLAHGIPSRRKDPRLGYLISRLGELGFDPKSARRIIAEAKSNRVGRLSGYGNAIVPELGAEFVRAWMDAVMVVGVPA